MKEVRKELNSRQKKEKKNRRKRIQNENWKINEMEKKQAIEVKKQKNNKWNPLQYKKIHENQIF